MALQPDIQYVRFYTAGSAARKLELQPKKEKAKISAPQRPQTRRRQKTLVYIDPISVFAVLVAGAMFIAMAVGMLRLGTVNSEVEKMNSYVAQLQAENTARRSEYHAGYDLKDVEQKALEMGLVPVDQVEKVVVEVPEIVEQPEPGFWEKVGAFFSELFGA
jgi:outer membrane murein-binding lipoprotein Lpp